MVTFRLPEVYRNRKLGAPPHAGGQGIAGARPGRYPRPSSMSLLRSVQVGRASSSSDALAPCYPALAEGLEVRRGAALTSSTKDKAMTTTAQAPRNVIFNGDCIDVMQAFDTGSVDFILTDPPYVTTATGRGVASPTTTTAAG